MAIWLLRHGDAEEGGEEHERRLTERGRAQAEAAGRALAALGAEPGACLSSPKRRALETAELACAALGIEPEAEPALAGGDFDPRALAAGREGETTLIVAHEPDISNAIARLTGARTEVKKGALACLEGATLVALLRPEQIALIAAAAGAPR